MNVQKYSDEEVRVSILQTIQEKKSETAESKHKARGAQTGKKVRGTADEEDLNIISSKPFVKTYQFNNFSEFLTEESALSIFNTLDQYRAEVNPELQLVSDENKKRILIEDKSKALKLSLKFFKVEDEDTRLKMRFIKKSGSVEDQYELLKELLPYLDQAIIEDEE